MGISSLRRRNSVIGALFIISLSINALLTIKLNSYPPREINNAAVDEELGKYVALSVQTATQSSTLGDFSASRAIDGDAETFSHTNDSNAWLEIDMGDVYPVKFVAIANRWCIDRSDPSGCLCRLSGVKLSLFDDSDSTVATASIGNACDLTTVTVEFDANCSTPTQSHQMIPSCLPVAKKLKLQSTTGQQINVFGVQIFSSDTSNDKQSSNQLVEVDPKEDVRKSTPQVHLNNIGNEKNRTIATASGNTGNKYLLFFSHDGFSNQFVGINGAIALAAKMGRTLVLPPITPHYTTMTGTLRYPLTYRGGGHSACNTSFEILKGDIDMLAKGIQLPVWSELFDFTLDSRDPQFHGSAHSGVSVIDLADFVRNKLTNFDEVEMLCDKLPYPMFNTSMLKHESSSQVAYAGSMFQLGLRVHTTVWKPSTKMFDVLQQVYGRTQAVMGKEGRAGLLPRDYVGLHVRVHDEAMVANESNCESKEFINSVGSNRYHLWNFFHQGRVIFLGSSSKSIKECVVSLATSYDKEFNKESGVNHTTNEFRAQVVMLEDILNNDIMVTKLIEEIKVEMSTVFLALDQFLIGLAQDILQINMMPVVSTYQIFVKAIHQESYRNDLLSELSSQ